MGYFESFIGVNFWTALFVLLNTLLIFFVAKKFLIVPVHKMITERQKEIDDMYENAGKAEQDANEMKAEYQQKLSQAQVTSERMVKEAVQRGQNREEEIIRQANEEASAILTRLPATLFWKRKRLSMKPRTRFPVWRWPLPKRWLAAN